MLYDASHVEDACDVTHGYVARLLSATLMAYDPPSGAQNILTEPAAAQRSEVLATGRSITWHCFCMRTSSDSKLMIWSFVAIDAREVATAF